MHAVDVDSNLKQVINLITLAKYHCFLATTVATFVAISGVTVSLSPLKPFFIIKRSSLECRQKLQTHAISGLPLKGLFVRVCQVPTLNPPQLLKSLLSHVKGKYWSVFVIHHFLGIWIRNWNCYSKSWGLKYGMWNANIFSVDWIAEWDFIFPRGGLWNGNNNPKIHSVTELDFYEHFLTRQIQELSHKMKERTEESQTLRAVTVSIVLKIANFLQMTRQLSE